MKYEKLLKQFDLPDWLIHNLEFLDDKMFLLWLQDNIVRLYEISLEFRDISMQLNNYHPDYIPYDTDVSCYDDDSLPFPF